MSMKCRGLLDMPAPIASAHAGPEDRRTAHVVGVSIDVLTWGEALARIGNWAREHESRYVCLCNAHSVVTAAHDLAFAKVIGGADMATPDGAPVAWMLRRLGHRGQRRINGPDLMWQMCELAALKGISVFLYGASDETLALLQCRLNTSFPKLKISGRHAPPFRPLSTQEEEAVVRMINASGAGIVWIGLGCPKQELWMASQKGRIAAVMIGVGAAFDFHAGKISRAPEWMRGAGLEWLHRLAKEPRRLWRRYLVTNTLFMLKASRQLLSRWADPRRGDAS